MSKLTENSQGSVWHRWDPHIHTPTTALANQYGDSSMDDFCDAVSHCQPTIRALGITDYLSIRGYRDILSSKRLGELPDVELLFPNVEFRLAIGTVKGSAVNAHLIFSPEDRDHVKEIERFLGSLIFRHTDDEYHCTKDDLVRLGRRHKSNVTDIEAAYREGVNQFKVDLDQLLDTLDNQGWAKNNCLIAVASSEGDGTSGLRTADDSFTALRRKIQAAAHIIFSANPKDRDYWLGLGTDSVQKLETEYHGPKPCLIGSDSHALARIGKHDQNRFCWIKGDLTFETLRQACIEPLGRVQIGSEPPRGALSAQSVETLHVTHASWMEPKEITLNPGLVTIIGARGSGKTALAECIATGAYAIPSRFSEQSFVARARDFLVQSTAQLKWANGETTAHSLTDAQSPREWDSPRLQYLSQHFVEELCSAEGWPVLSIVDRDDLGRSPL